MELRKTQISLFKKCRLTHSEIDQTMLEVRQCDNNDQEMDYITVADLTDYCNRVRKNTMVAKQNKRMDEKGSI